MLERDPCIIKLANAWIILNSGGGPTDDKPEVHLAPPSDLNNGSSFMNIGWRTSTPDMRSGRPRARSS